MRARAIISPSIWGWTARTRRHASTPCPNGVELEVDLGRINGQVFVNNASFGAYAEVVETPSYRDDKLNTTLNLLPDLLQGHRGARLFAQAESAEIMGAAGAAGGQQPVRNR